jgi:hypothetical protein
MESKGSEMTTVYPHMYLTIVAMNFSDDDDCCVSTTSDNDRSHNLRVGPHKHRFLVYERVRMPPSKI